MLFPAIRTCLATTFITAMLVPCALAQRAGDPHAGGAVDLPSAGSPIMERNTDPRSVFISGKVVLQGGGPAGRIAIERICNGMVRREGYTNSKGNFQFELGRNSTDRDASQADSDRMVTNKNARVPPSGPLRSPRAPGRPFFIFNYRRAQACEQPRDPAIQNPIQ